MRTVREIYETYKIAPNLQLHQLRVAAVGKLVCDDFAPSHGEHIDDHSIVLTGLFHDMGNILKFDFSFFAQFVEPEGIEYWESVKEEYREKYGPDEHIATIMIAKEIQLPESVIALIDGIGFSKLENVRDHASFEQKIVEYADTRVGPYGVLSVRDRLEDARKRYQKNPHPDIPQNRERFDELMRAAMDIEEQIFSKATIRPEDIHDASVVPIIKELWEYTIA